MKLVIAKSTVEKLTSETMAILQQTNRAVGGCKLDAKAFNPMAINDQKLANMVATEDETDFTLEINDKVLFAIVKLYAKIFGIINPLISAMIVGFTGLRSCFKDVEEVMSEQAVKEEKEEKSNMIKYHIKITIPEETPSFIANPFNTSEAIYRTETWVLGACDFLTKMVVLDTELSFEKQDAQRELKYLREAVEEFHNGKVILVEEI